MLESAWIFVGLVALSSTAVAASTKTGIAATSPNADGLAIMSGVLGFISWGIWSYGSLNVELATDGGSVVVYSLPALTYLGIAFALVPGYIALTGPADIVRRAKQPTADDI